MTETESAARVEAPTAEIADDTTEAPPVEIAEHTVESPAVESEEHTEEGPAVEVSDDIVDAPAPEAAPAIEPPSPVTAPRGFEEIVAAHFEALLQYQRAVLESEDLEAVHKFRVTTRRLQAALDLLQFKTDPLRIRAMKTRLRRCRRSLSLVRNYDVFVLLIESEVASARQIHSESIGTLRTAFGERRAWWYARARRRLERADFISMSARLGVAPGSEPGGDITEHGVLETDETRLGVRDRAAARLEQRLSELQLMAAQSHATTDPRKMHELRIAAKRMRYLLETVSEMGYGDAGQALDWLRTLQERLGDWHDLAALEDEIIDIVGRRKFIRKHLVESATIIQLAGRLRKKRTALDSKLFPVKVPRSMAAITRRMVRALRQASTPSVQPLHE